MNAFIIDPKDSIVTVTEPVTAGGKVTYMKDGSEVIVTASSDIPMYHKVAVKPVAKGESVLKYGEEIGLALRDILPGDHVHVHNLSDIASELAKEGL